MTTTEIHLPSVDELRFRLQGGVHEPGSAYYEDSCTLFNAMIDHRPLLVVECLAVDDVVAALAFSRDHELPVAVRAGGHSVAGLSLADRGVVLDVRGMADIDVDVDRRVLRVGGGAVWAEVDRRTQAHGLATTGGRVSTTGVAGLTLGGGSGWLERKHGLACDNLLAVELVTWDGTIVRASAQENSELLWAMRGGGGNFGVVTTLELRLHPLDPEVFAGVALFAAHRAGEVVRAFRDLMSSAPDELSLACAFITAPEDDDVPSGLRGRPAVAVLGMWAGDVAAGEEALAPIRGLGPDADLFGATAYADFQCSVDDPPGYRNYWTAESLADLTDEAIDLLVRRARELPSGPSQLFIVAWGGAVRRHGPAHSPLAGRDAGFIVHPLLLWEDPADDERCRALARRFRADVRPWSVGATYPNFLGEEGDARMAAAYGPNAARLAAVKRAWDPHGVFRTHQTISTHASLEVTHRASGRTRRSVHVGGLELHTEQVGQGPDVLLIGGLGDTVESWDLQLDGLADRYRLTAFDNRGAGRSARSDEAPSVVAMADDAAGVLRALGVVSAHVAGFSGGSVIAQELAIRHPHLVRSLVLQSTWARPDSYLRAWGRFVRWLVDVAPSERAFLEAFFLDIYTARAHEDGTVAAIIDMALELPHKQAPQDLQRFLDAFMDHDTSARLPGISAPTLVLAGGRDSTSRPELGRVVADLVPGARFEVMAEEAHQPFQEVPDQWNARVDEFWRQVDHTSAVRRAAGDERGTRGAR